MCNRVASFLPPSGWRRHPFKDVIVGRAAEPRGSERDPQAQQGPGLGPRGGRALVYNRVRERAVRCGISHMTMEVRWRWMGMDCYDNVETPRSWKVIVFVVNYRRVELL